MTWLVPLLPVVFGLALWCAGDRRRRSSLALAAVAGVLVTLGLALASLGMTSAFRWGPGLVLTLQSSGLSRVMALLVPVIAAPVIGYAAFHEPRRGLARLVGLLCCFVGAMELLVLADDLLTLLVGWELVGIVSWALIGFEWRELDKVQSAAHAFVPTRFGDLGLFVAAGAAFGAEGSTRFEALAHLHGPALHVVVAGVLVAAVAKSGQLPFSPWLSSAMAGPTPVSALLHSATMVAAGAYALARLQPALSSASWFGPTVVAIGLTTALAGGVVALVQDHAKRVLAASTSAQYGLMFVAIGAGYPGAAGAHLVTQAFFKALLFLAVGVAMQTAGTGDITAMRLGRALPATAGFALAGSLALAAAPPLGAAWSKEAIVAAAGEQSLAVAFGVVIAGALSAAYGTRLHLLAFGRGPLTEAAGPSPGEVAALATLAGGTVALSVLWLPGSADRIAELTGGPVAEGALALSSLGVVAVFAGFLAGRRLVRYPIAVAPVVADWFGLPAATRRLIVDPVLAAAKWLAAFDAGFDRFALDTVIVRPAAGAARALAVFDGRVVDAGVRATGALALGASRVLARRDDLSVDALVEWFARAGARLADGAGRSDDRLLDGAAEGVASGVGVAGRLARRTQTGMAHHYLLIVAGGIAVLALLARAWR